VKKTPKKKVAAVTKKSAAGIAGDIGVLPPLGFFDPLGFTNRGPEVYRRYQEIEIKHGRFAMAACLGVIVTEAGIRFPGYLSISQDIKLADVGGDLADAYFGIPLGGWANRRLDRCTRHRCVPPGSFVPCRRRGAGPTH